MILAAFAACKAGIRPCSPSSPNSATAPAGRCNLAEFLRFEVHHKAYPVIHETPWMDVFLRGQSSPRLQATVVSTLSAFVSKNVFAAKMQMHFQNQNIMDDPTHGNRLILCITQWVYHMILGVSNLNLMELPRPQVHGSWKSEVSDSLNVKIVKV